MLLNRYFVMQGDLVINLIVYDGGGWNPPQGCHIIPEVEGVGIGWKLVDGQWEPPQIEEPAPDNI